MVRPVSATRWRNTMPSRYTIVSIGGYLCLARKYRTEVLLREAFVEDPKRCMILLITDAVNGKIGERSFQFDQYAHEEPAHA